MWKYTNKGHVYLCLFPSHPRVLVAKELRWYSDWSSSTTFFLQNSVLLTLHVLFIVPTQVLFHHIKRDESRWLDRCRTASAFEAAVQTASKNELAGVIISTAPLCKHSKLLYPISKPWQRNSKNVGQVLLLASDLPTYLPDYLHTR